MKMYIKVIIITTKCQLPLNCTIIEYIIIMNKYEITWDEQYHLIKLYDLLRDTGMIDDLPKEIETFFEKLLD